MAEASTLRVLKIAPTSFFADYGCHVRIVEETVALKAHGVDVRICCYPGGRDVLGVTAERTIGMPWTGVRVGSSKHRSYLDALLALKSARVALAFRPDVVHAHLHEGALIGYPIGRALGVPLVFDFQGSLTSEMVDHNFLRRDSLAFGPILRLERFINRLPGAIVTSSQNAADALVGQFGCERARVRAVPDAVDTARFRPRWHHAPVVLRERRRRLGIPDGKRVVVYLGLLAEYQGSGHLLRAAARIAAARDDVHFLMMGFPGEARYRDYAEQLGIAERVTFTGRVAYEDAPLNLAVGDLAVSPKISETEGNGKLLNYMAVGLPTVTFNTPVSREILGDLGVFAATGDDESLARGINDLLAAPEWAEARGRELRARAEERFSWAAAARELLKIYESLQAREVPAVATG